MVRSEPKADSAISRQLPNGGAVAVGAYVDASDTDDCFRLPAYDCAACRCAGVVLGASDNQPIVGARVKAVDDSRFTLTDIEGHYRLELAAGMCDIMVSERDRVRYRLQHYDR
ncbi:MAG: carboxypeptidase regulatory-like domain-containing protein [bacterium]|nr:carboxypeptidase regulatory-like domain-containing protein [bacterium]